MLAALHVLRYLLNDPVQAVLLSSSSDMSLASYSDSDWAACAISCKSVTAEAEYRALRKFQLRFLGCSDFCLILTGLISLHFIFSSNQLADIMTKALPGPVHHGLLCKLGFSSVVFRHSHRASNLTILDLRESWFFLLYTNYPGCRIALILNLSFLIPLTDHLP
ncbi:PREDICTED: uncharacterized protein LOC109220682 [Nicotiana attenuata]|uniref:uncharacterized protein LOC109220682 n=1 Tax=Nicotiana attenuata TaxID=49451 RepID=UPI00090524C7|nr:PREDICTED: uncharacterized protein LOC109220682 [Nicotiana attenuata]